MTDQISRRTIAKGVAWSVPTVALAAAAPAVSASTPLLPCPAGSCLTHTATTPSYSVTSYDSDPGPGFQFDSNVQLNFGAYAVTSACIPAGTTGFRIEFTSVTAKDQSGGTWTGTNLTQPALATYVWNIGGSLWVAADFKGFAYNGPAIADPDWDANHYLASYSVAYKITYVKVLAGIETPLTDPCPRTVTITATPNVTYIGGGLTGAL